VRTSPRGFLKAVRLPVTSLTVTLAQILGRTVIDQAGLTGNSDMSLDWTPDEGQAMQLLPGVPEAAPPTTPPPSIFTAF
jgi:uncharacterized protein (TIGR03435 family)